MKTDRKPSETMRILAVASLMASACGGNGGGKGTDGETDGGSETSGTTSTSESSSDSAGTVGTAGTAGTAGTSGATTGVDPGDAIRELIEARCAWMFDCCATGELAYTLGPFTGSREMCVERILGVLETGSTSSPLEAGPSDLLLFLKFSHALDRMEFNGDAVAACVQHLATAACTPRPGPPTPHCEPGTTDPDTDPCALDRIAVGKQAIGQDCEPALQAECLPGSRCVNFGNKGVCAGLGVVGESCFADGDCVSPLVCDFAGGGACAAGSEVGGPCAFSDPTNPVLGTESQRCERGLFCDPTGLTCVGGTCAPGAPCATDSQCPEDYLCIQGSCLPVQDEGGPCATHLHCVSGICNFVTLTCTAPTGVADGQPCMIYIQCRSGWCHPTNLLCEPKSEPGEPCDALSNLQCTEGLCDTTDPANPVCRAYSGQGEPCTTALECDPVLGVTCFNDICQDFPNGETCTVANQCQSGLCWMTLCDDFPPHGAPCGGVDQKPCAADAYCSVPLGQTAGICTVLNGAGSPCTGNLQCWGLCDEIWGERMCDDTPPTDFAWCDGV